MPTVPTYDSPTVAAQPLPDVQNDPRASLRAMAAVDDAGKEAQQLGKATQGLGNEFAKEEYQTQIELNSADAKTYDVNATTEATKKFQDWKTNANGLDARKSQQDILDDIKQTYSDAANDLQKTNPGAVKAFALQAQQRMAELQLQINGHVDEQDKLGIKGAALARAEAQAGLAVNMKSDPVGYKNAVDIGLNEIKQVAAKEYGSDNTDMINKAVLNYTTKVSTEAIKTFISEGNAAAANDFMKTHWNEIDPLQRAELEKTVKSFNDTTIANQAAQDIFQKMAPPIGSKDSVNIYDMEQKIRDQFKDNPDQQKLAITAVRDQYAAFMQQRNGMATDAGAKVYDLLSQNMNMSPSQLRATPEWLALEKLNPQLADGMLDHAEQRQYANLARANAMDARNDAAEARKQRNMAIKNFGAYLEYSNIDKLNSMSEDEIKNLLPTLGNELTGDLMKMKRSIVKTDGKVLEAKIDEDDFKTVAAGIGLPVYNEPSKVDATTKAQIGYLKHTVETQIDLQQQGTGKQLTRQEKIKLMQQIVDDKVMTGGSSLFGFNLTSGTPTPAALVTPEQQDKVYNMVGNEKVYANTIPRDFVQTAIKQRPNASSADIAKAWVKSRDKWGK